MKLVGLTGGIATGKSTVSSFLSSDHHVPIIDADRIARSVLEPGQPAYHAVIAAFGPDILQDPSKPNSPIARPTLASRIFGDAKARQRLNRLTHPRIRRIMLQHVICHFLSPYEIQVSRLVHRDSLDPSDAKQRIAAQMKMEDKKRLATLVIDNGKSLQVTRASVQWMVQQVAPTSWWMHGVAVVGLGLVAGCVWVLLWMWDMGDRLYWRLRSPRRPSSSSS